MERLIQVAAYLNVSEAEAARIRLAWEGIPSAISNAALVSWFWHYSNATGGVKVWVREAHLKWARLLLFPKPIPKMFRPAPWTCPQCSAEVDGLWSLCWSCGSTRTGERGCEFQPDVPPTEGSRLKRFFEREPFLPVILIFLFVFILFQGAFWVLLALLVTVFLVFLWTLLAASKAASFAEEPPSSEKDIRDSSADPGPDEFTPAEDHAERAWRAAFFGWYWCPLLVYYAFWLLIWVAILPPSCSKRIRRQYLFAWIIVFLAGPFYLLPLGMMISEILRNKDLGFFAGLQMALCYLLWLFFGIS